MEPGPVFVLTQGTDSEEFLGEGGSSHIPDLLSNPPHASASPGRPPLRWLQGTGQKTSSALCLQEDISS